MCKKVVVSIMFFAVINMLGCASWSSTYQQMGKYRSKSEVNENKVEPKDVEVFVKEYPKGFEYNDGILSVADGYNYEILGEVSIEYKQGNTAAFIIVGLLTFTIGSHFIMAPPEMNKDIAVGLLQSKASEMGGNTVIGASLPSGNNDYEGASGIVVYIPASS